MYRKVQRRCDTNWGVTVVTVSQERDQSLKEGTWLLEVATNTPASIAFFDYIQV